MSGETLIVFIAGIILVTATIVPFIIRQRRREHETATAQALAKERGLHEPVTLHPVVDPSACIGTGNCIEVCPEGDVLGLRNGQAVAVNPARCIGHGLCERSCPVSAIQLVFGSEKRGVEIPRIRENFETNVPGIYIIGELGGMGLIRNAFEQGRQCIEGIAKEKRMCPPEALELLIVGCGPAGLSASLHALHRGLRFQTIEKEDIGGTVRSYPRKKLVMTAPVKVPGFGRLGRREMLKEELVEVWQEIVEHAELEVRTRETLRSVTPTENGCFTAETDRATYVTRRIVLAIGRRGVPRKLGVPGEDVPKVAYSLSEAEAFRNDRVLVVGGGDSAVEAAVALAEQGNVVTVSYRGSHLSRIKLQNQARLDQAVANGRIDILWSTTVVEIRPASVLFRDSEGLVHELPNDFVFVMIGGEMPTTFLHSCGIEIDTKFGEPVRVV